MSGRRALMGLAAVFLAALALHGAEQANRERRADNSEPGRGASWIWAADAAKRGEPVTFMAVRDFRLENRRRAWVNLTVDESYVLWVNGVRVGSGTYREGRPAELYDISSVLKVGWNRLMVEASSSRGAGGLLASLRLDEPHGAIFGTDEEWRIFERCEPWLLGGSRAIGPSDGDVPALWRKPPSGRWRPPSTLSLARGLDLESTPYPAIRLRHPVAAATSGWRELPPGAPLPNLESQVVFDFGRVVTGHLEMGLKDDAGPALIFFDLEAPPSPSGRDAHGVLVPMPGLREWHDPQARRFRFVTIVGAAPSGWAQVRPAPAAEAPLELTRGVFGLKATSPFRRVAEDIWTRLTDPESERSP